MQLLIRVDARKKIRESLLMANLVNQPTLAPTRKVEFASYAGAIVTIVIFIFEYMDPELSVPPEVAAALTTVIAPSIAWCVRERAPVSPLSGVPAE
jgi:hypothetical protein